MLVKDSPLQVRWRREVKRETSASLRQKALQENIVSNTISVSDDAGRDTSSLTAQLGRPMTTADVISKLKLCNPRLVFEVSNADSTKQGIYLQESLENKTFICGMENGVMPEFSVLHRTTIQVPNEDLFGRAKPTREVSWKNVPTFYAETRGWRTVLLRLLHQNLITESQVREHFGWTPSQNSEKWHDQTKTKIELGGSNGGH